MDTAELADLVRRFRKGAKLTQEELAAQLVAKGVYDNLSREMVRRAEDPTYEAGEKMYALRVNIVSMLSGRELHGPLWVWKDEISA